uniref:INSM transcriptional repressor 2 n=1 Tax=Malurus cyaneus samueli TaxID=2593467 RepID=A0A8C5TAV1_9PASS
MPRGFLVKRSRRPGGSYRRARGSGTRSGTLRRPAASPPPPARRRLSRDVAHGGGCGGPGLTPPEGPSAWGHGPCSAAGPRAALFERCLSSPASAESFPLAASFPPAEKLLLQPRTPLPAPPLPSVPALKRPSRAKAPAKKGKATRKLSFADEVTTSPVLGLRIKEEGPEGRPGPPAGRTPLGEFICQLCKEQYADPLALAQHRCSRIVRVEYRCPECHKIFSCPANLASHRRWHKPRPAQRRAPVRPAGQGRRPRSRAAPRPVGGGAGGRRSLSAAKAVPGYLRKHLGTHGQRGRSLRPAGARALAFACHLAAPASLADIRTSTAVQPAGELLLRRAARRVPRAAAGGERQGFPCKHCPATFFSAPGLARHASKCHPPENRQVLLLQVPVRPGC